MAKTTFEWDEKKNLENQRKHQVSFEEAQYVFLDRDRVIAKDLVHSEMEERYYCFGLDQAQEGILTVRFTYRENKIRIFGAGYWRKGKKVYEETNAL